MRLANKVAIVTGGARGIGRATAELFAEEGATVVVADLSLDTPLAEGIEFVEHDVTDEDSWRELVAGVVARHGRVDVLFNNAGTVGSYEPIDTIDPEVWKRIVDINLNGCFYGVRHVVPVMRENGGGSIVNTSSIWGIAGAAGVSAYTASKAAVRSLSKNVALSYVGDGIRCNSVHPGIIDTPMIEAQDAGVTAGIVDITPMKRLGSPREIAYGVLFLASDESSYMTGSELVIDGGYTAQ
ncbi:glucose 1-dehydrogenase [Herbiconiux sp. KACC 21604]|uniref:SDR family NAD(P)-dependent oxidoreductase n=1 Tax=unclassified Herbiconiux TaxID=2618217 RepID=UPI001492DBE1|nr:glucose 1-dehydrogenase [Herbiconiux sp. SALV-R1]QJU54929.1 glucose 1-dehydrogenase [Herbiconiux sp. SALV-R1]WPO86054.1 glucose 1-dehydrogenase [Herbiconiux sp. KACC 21604]